MIVHPGIRAFFRAPSGIAATVFLLTIAALTILAPAHLGKVATTMSVLRSGEGPSADFLLGTDMLGRSILARALVATGLSVSLTMAATAIAATLGITFGVVVALSPPVARRLGLRAIDILLSFPGILLAIAVTAIVGTTAEGAVVAIGIAYAPDFARLGSTLASAVAAREFVAAARVLGVGPLRLFRRHILPNIGDSMIVAVFSTSASALVAVSSLSFLGLGVQPPQYDWGRMLVEGVDAFYITPFAVLAPAILIAGTGLALGFFGEALARALNPLLWTQGAEDRVELAPATGGESPAGAAAPPALLEVEDLRVSYPAAGGRVPVVAGVSFAMREGEVVGIVGESGSGKTQAALAIARLIAPPGEVDARRLVFGGRDLLAPGDHDRFLGRSMAMIFQDPMSSLNPTLRIGLQVAEPARLHAALDWDQAFSVASERLAEVQIPNPRDRLRQYPHEFSGGMQQRSMIAMGLVNNPRLMIADEPTTALDVTIQAQVIEVLRGVNRRHGTAILLISHNIGVISELCSRVLVMYAGRIVEDIQAEALASAPAHPYTQALLASIPDLATDRHLPLESIAGRPPDPGKVGAGCSFAPRCPRAIDRCSAERPSLENLSPAWRVACWMATKSGAA